MAGSAIVEVETYSASVVGPDADDLVTAASVRVMGAPLANRTKYLKAVVSDGAHTITCSALTANAITCNTTFVSTGTSHLVGVATIDDADVIGVQELTINTKATWAAGALLLMNTTAQASFAGRIRWKARAFMTDMDQTLDAATATQWQLSTSPGAPRTISLKKSNALNDETISLFIEDMNASANNGDQYIIEELAGATLATFTLHSGFHTSVWARFRYVGSSWVLDENVGYHYNSVGAYYYGCRPGA